MRVCTHPGSHSPCSPGSLRFHFVYPVNMSVSTLAQRKGKNGGKEMCLLARGREKIPNARPRGCQPEPPNPTAPLLWAPARPKDVSPTSLPCWPEAYSRTSGTGMGLCEGKRRFCGWVDETEAPASLMRSAPLGSGCTSLRYAGRGSPVRDKFRAASMGRGGSEVTL